MAVMREHPYGRFNFLVDLGTGSTDGPDAGFQECSAIATEVAVVEYRNGNDRENAARKLPGLTKVADVTLKRGVVGSLALFEWIRAVRDGTVERRNVTIQLVAEDRSGAVITWRLLRAFPVKYVAGPLNAQANEVAMEELTLSYERLELE
jgi:phage tail-like protein